MTAKSEPVYIGTKKVYEVRYQADGSIALVKTVPVKSAHIYNLTGSPGWDKPAVDRAFKDNRKGWLEYSYEGHVYSISIGDFREHAFEKEAPGFGVQYHVHAKFYTTRAARTISPTRVDAARKTHDDIVDKLPPRIVFGELIPCPSCKGKGGDSCLRCMGHGLVHWKPSSASPSTSTTEPTPTSTPPPSRGT